MTLLSYQDFGGSAGSDLRFRAFTGEADVDVPAAAKSPEWLAIPEGPAQFACGLFGAVPSWMGAPGPRPVAAVGLGPVSFTLASVDTAPFGMGLPPDSSGEGRARNRAAYAAMGQVMSPARELFEQILAELGVPEGPVPFFLDSTVLKADRFLQLSVEELSYKRSDTPAHIKFVGTLPPAVASNDLPAWWPEVTGTGKAVVVTQGTLGNLDFADLIEPTLQGLADFPGLVVAATGRPGEVRNVPPNARIAEFIPFDDLLPHTDVLVTNGGFGAVQQALRHGVPMVAAGLSEEKQENNVRLAATGAAINLATNRPASDDVRKAVDTVLTTDSYQANAQRLAAEYAKLNALEEVKKAVNELAGRKQPPLIGLFPLEPPALIGRSSVSQPSSSIPTRGRGIGGPAIGVTLLAD